MDSARWEQVQNLFHQAVDLPAADQKHFLASACKGDRLLLEEVLGMIEEDALGSTILDGGVAGLADQVLGDGVPADIAQKAFGPYQIRSLLGEGGMGVVYLAERADLGSQVAIKILRDAWLSPARRERFASEQRTLAQLNHPSIARLYDADTLPDGTPWFAMEYVEGVPLNSYCRSHDCSIGERLRLFRAVCEAVKFAHSQTIVHRDLKPSNILVKSDGSVRLLDFGIARQLETLEGAREDGNRNHTMTGLRLMTPAYASPEQILGQGIGVQTDVYALGVILYELLAERLPFDLSNLTPAEAASVITGQEAARPSSIAARSNEADAKSGATDKTLWTDLDVLSLTAMHRDTSRRYASVEALIRDVDHLLSNEPLEAHTDTIAYWLGKFVRRNRAAVTALSLVFTVIVGLVVFFTVRLAIARNAAVEEAARTQRIQRFMLNLFQGGDEAAGPADDMRVTALLERGVQEAKALDGEPQMQAELYQTLGSVYQKLGKLDEADSLLHSALERHKQIDGKEHPDIAEDLVAIGLLRSDQAHLEEAERLVREGLAMSQRTLPANHPAVARATTALGMILENRGEYDQAIQVLQDAVRLQSTPGTESPDLAASLTELANCQFYAGHYDAADSINRRVLEMDKSLYGTRHPHVADDLINLGAIQFQWGRYADAEAFNRQAYEITLAWYGKDNPETASAATLLARSLIELGRADEAETLLQQALTVQERVYGKVHPRVASVLSDLGKVAEQRGHFEAARQYFTRMADIYRSVYGDKHYLIAVALSNVGSVELDEQHYGKAEAILREVVQRFTDSLSAAHFNTAVARIKLGRALQHEHRYNEAEVESLAGYNLLRAQKNPSQHWLQYAREDLAAIYVGLKEPEKAKSFQEQLSASVTAGSGAR
jgi:eukaryotic-like serine/threonine-protein kinase